MEKQIIVFGRETIYSEGKVFNKRCQTFDIKIQFQIYIEYYHRKNLNCANLSNSSNVKDQNLDRKLSQLKHFIADNAMH